MQASHSLETTISLSLSLMHTCATHVDTDWKSERWRCNYDQDERTRISTLAREN